MKTLEQVKADIAELRFLRDQMVAKYEDTMKHRSGSAKWDATAKLRRKLNENIDQIRDNLKLWKEILDAREL